MANNLEKVYFEWMYDLVLGNDQLTNITYKKLMWFLYNTEFTYLIDRDENRAADGIDFRYKFGLDNGYSEDEVTRQLDTRPCSVLEMMVSLAFRLEDQIMDDYDYGNRTGQWFWNMVVSLGLGRMSDEHFDQKYVEEVIFRFLNIQYKPNGEGGLFTLEHPKYDLRNEEIWYQAMWYLDENFDFSI